MARVPGCNGRKARRAAGLATAVWVVAACAPPTDASGPLPDEPTAQEIRCTQSFGDPAESPYILPYKVEETYRVIQSYCPSNPSWGHYGWLAYDFDMATGDTVLASRAGTVLFTRRDQPDIGGRCGVNGENLVLLRHDDGTVMSYVHFTANGVLVRDGERVEQGQPIGLSGNSGCSTGPHLHVALFEDRTSYDASNTIPLNYRNADGPLDERNGLIYQKSYTAEPWR